MERFAEPKDMFSTPEWAEALEEMSDYLDSNSDTYKD